MILCYCNDILTAESIRESNDFSGRVVNVTSVKGVFPSAFSSAYCISKAGAEAFSDVLRMEMKKWGVKVSVIEPGQYDDCTMITKVYYMYLLSFMGYFDG